MFKIIFIVSVMLQIHLIRCMSNVTFLNLRKNLLNSEDSKRVGFDITLTEKETQVNSILMRYKRSEIAPSAADDNVPFPPALHFFKARSLIEKSTVFKSIKAMPKGAALHIHDVSLVNLNWLIKEATYLPECFMCIDKNDVLQFKMFKSIPSHPDCQWYNVNEERKKFPNSVVFDQLLYNNMSMIVPDPEKAYPNQAVVWQRFLNALGTASGLILYAPIFKKYYYQALSEFYVDNVQYLEVRMLLSPVYELDGTVHDREWALNAWREVSQQFVRDHSDFIGSKIISSSIRFVERKVIEREVDYAIQFRQKYPDFYAGFDLVGQEDPGHSLLYFMNELLKPSQMSPPFDLPYFFHAGETDWKGEAVDKNLIDALLLNTTRIGHGYGILKHPEALRLVKEKGVAIEVNPISNQVLKLVSDLRNHPGSYLLANNYPVVICPDDPSVWGAEGLSYDFYETFMGLASADADLKLLKQLAINSIKYSAMTPSEKKRAMDLWQAKWDSYINE